MELYACMCAALLGLAPVLWDAGQPYSTCAYVNLLQPGCPGAAMLCGDDDQLRMQPAWIVVRVLWARLMLGTAVCVPIAPMPQQACWLTKSKSQHQSLADCAVEPLAGGEAVAASAAQALCGAHTRWVSMVHGMPTTRCVLWCHPLHPLLPVRRCGHGHTTTIWYDNP